MLWLRMLPWAGWLVAGGLMWLWLETRDDVAEARAQCNADKAMAVAEAERITRAALEAAALERVAEAERIAEAERKARRAAEVARVEAENRPIRVKEIIKESTDACMDAAVPAAVLDSLRD